MKPIRILWTILLSCFHIQEESVFMLHEKSSIGIILPTHYKHAFELCSPPITYMAVLLNIEIL